VLLTFTEYNQSPKEDRLLFDILLKHYSKIMFWPQMFGDYAYAKKIAGSKVEFVDPSVNALDDMLNGVAVDYVGTRLHAGIRALQHFRRTIIIAVDNRATEMGKDFNLPILPREQLGTHLGQMISTGWKTSIRINAGVIARWRNQFRCGGAEASGHHALPG
jgi:hypothetical protein